MSLINLVVNDLHVATVDKGSGPVALLLHGWGVDSRNLAPTEPVFKNHRVIAPDLPGFGASQTPEQAWYIGDYSAFIMALLKKLEVQKVDVLLGHSFGGRIALDLAGNRLVTPRRLVLIGSHGLPEPKSVQRRFARILAKIGKVVTAPAPESQREKLRRQLYKWFGSDDYMNSGALHQTFLNVIRQDASDIAPNIKAETLLIYGKDDQLTRADYFGLIYNKLIPGSRLEVIERAGHYTHVDQTESVNKLIKEFIK